MIKVLIVDDSPVAREYLLFLLIQDQELEVLGAVSSGAEALAFLRYHRPDVITMDVEMPEMDGYQTTRAIMERYPVPIVIVTSSWRPEDLEKTFKALNAGALAVLKKPDGLLSPDADNEQRELIRTIKDMAGISVSRRWIFSRIKDSIKIGLNVVRPADNRETRLIVIGASTGGPQALNTILSGLPANFGMPVAIVQHITVGFIDGLAHWLQSNTPLKITIAGHQELMLPGHVYLAPDDLHLSVTAECRALLSSAPPINNLRPSVASLFRSAAESLGAYAAGVLLTGMGRDGAEELRLIKQAGGMTIAQNKETCAVFGMPQAAIECGAAEYILPPEQISVLLASLARPSKT